MSKKVDEREVIEIKGRKTRLVAKTALKGFSQAPNVKIDSLQKSSGDIKEV